MNSQSTIQSLSLPARVKVAIVRQGRYSSEEALASVRSSHWHVPDLHRPLNWDKRVDGLDIVALDDGTEVKLLSTGMQSVPQPGWILLLTGGDSDTGYSWTLYGISNT